MPIYLGSTERTDIYLGSTEIQKVYLGTTQVYASYYTLTGFVETYDFNDSGNGSLTASFNTNGTISVDAGADSDGITRDIFAWHDAGTVSGIGNSRWAKKTLISGDTTTGTLTTSLVSLSSVKTITIQTGPGGEGKSALLLIEIYSDSGGTQKVGEINFTITFAV